MALDAPTQDGGSSQRIEQALARLEASHAVTAAHVEALDRRMTEGMSRIIERMDLRFAAVDIKLDAITHRVAVVEQSTATLVAAVQQLVDRVSRLEGYRSGWVQTATWSLSALSLAVGVATFVWKTFHGG